MNTKKRLIFAALPVVLIAAALAFALVPASADGEQAEKTQISAEACYAESQDSLLYIRSYNETDSLKSTGSGFIVSPEGLSVTAAHVIDGGSRVTAIMREGTEVQVEVLSCDTATDVAVVRLPEGTYTALAIAAEAPNAGAKLYAMGYPMKDTLIITDGIVASPIGEIAGKTRMMVTCPIVNGMSGGPIFNNFGEAAGMASGSVRTMEGINLSALFDAFNGAVYASQTAE